MLCLATARKQSMPLIEKYKLLQSVLTMKWAAEDGAIGLGAQIKEERWGW
jgi:hypothetical protein